jgi:nitrogen fixation protein NifX
MTQAALSDDIALRIALAARALPDTEPARLIDVLDDAIGLPPTAEKLSTLQIKVFKNALGGELSDVDLQALQEAVAILKGDEESDTVAPPPVESYAEGDMPDAVRVACASNAGELLDGHFGSAKRFLVYQVSASENRLIDVRVPDDAGAYDRNAYRAGLIADCQVLYVASIGGPAAAKVVKADVHPIKDPKGGSARERILALQQVLGSKAPPWLAKVMGQAPEERLRFERGASEP